MSLVSFFLCFFKNVIIIKTQARHCSGSLFPYIVCQHARGFFELRRRSRLGGRAARQRPEGSELSASRAARGGGDGTAEHEDTVP